MKTQKSQKNDREASEFTMATLRMNIAAPKSSANPNHHGSSHEETQNTQTQKVSQYEQSREDRIKENRERLKKLGIVDISLQLKANFQPKRSTAAKSYPNRATTPSGPSLIRPIGPVRRSSRLQNATPVSYSDAHLEKEDRAVGMKGIRLEEGAKPEIYSEEDEKKLGNTDKSWTLFVDGYGNDGKRMYDPVRGKTCHQCRQKTLGYHTDCSQCGKVQGQFCGDCLYMRYGEHVLEAIENSDWICPACRGICNCSFCRTAKGWAPTGVLYKKISQLGYKSVAHYLIQTQRSQTGLGESPETTNQVSAKRSLHFLDVDASCEETLKDDNSDIGMTPLAEHNVDEFKTATENDRQIITDIDNDNQTSAKRSLSFPDMGQLSENSGSPVVDHKVDHLALSKPRSESSRDDLILKGEKDDKVHMKDIKLGDGTNTLGSISKSRRRPARDIEPSADSIAGRLRQRHRKGNNDHDDDPDVQILSEKELTGVLYSDNKHDGNSATELDKSSELSKKRAFAAELSSDSIGGRLRQRRKSHCHADKIITV